MVPDGHDHFTTGADRSLYRDLSVPVRNMDKDEKNHRKSACLQQILSSSCISALTFEESWSGGPSLTPTHHARGPPLPPLRGRHSLVLRRGGEQDDFSKNRFAAVLLQQDQCTPPTRRVSADQFILASSDSSTATWSVPLASSSQTFDDSSVLTVETDVLEERISPKPHQGSSFPLRVHSGSENATLPTKTPRGRLTSTSEAPEDMDNSNGNEQALLLDEMVPLPHCLPPLSTTRTTIAPLQDHSRHKPHPTLRKNLSPSLLNLP